MTYSFCHACGASYGAQSDFPKTCSACGHIHFKNPIPVAVALVPCEDGLLGVVRGIEPQLGHLALPGGYVDMETLEEACSRELLEETGVDLPPKVWIYDSCHLTHIGNLLVFFRARIEPIKLPPFPFAAQLGVRDETLGLKVIRRGDALAFASHEQAVANYAMPLAKEAD